MIESTTIQPTTLLDEFGNTTSLIVAQALGTRHFHLLRHIRTQMERSSESFRLLNFTETTRIDAKGESQPLIVMTRLGATVGVLSLTGKSTIALREGFIKELSQSQLSPAVQQSANNGRLERAEREILKVTRELVDVQRELFSYARREIRSLRTSLMSAEIGKCQQPLDFDLSGLDDLPALDLDLARGLEG